MLSGSKGEKEHEIYRKTGDRWQDIKVKAKVIAVGISGRLHVVDGGGRIYWPECDIENKSVTKLLPSTTETTNHPIIIYSIGAVLCLVSCFLIPLLLCLLSRT